jgi:DNA-binding PadR family transcriptional regulator
MLAARSWTGYELTRQMRRSLRFVWASSEGHLYREQKRLVELGWADVVTEPSGGRSRKRYTITEAGEEALRVWLSTRPQEPHFEIEGLLRLFFGDRAAVEDITASMETTARAARSMLDELQGFVDDYLAEGGPLWMLEHGVGGADQDRLEFRGRPMFPERLHVIALVIDAVTRLLAEIEVFSRATAAELGGWQHMADPANTAATRARLEAIRARLHTPDNATLPTHNASSTVTRTVSNSRGGGRRARRQG